MARGRDWLDRFRPAGSPGSPARPGVPADVDERDRTLVEVLELLETVAQECARIRAQADRQATSRRDAAAAAAAELLADAQARVPEARAEAFALGAAQARAERERATAGSTELRLREAAHERMPAVVSAVRRELFTQLTALTRIDFPMAARDLSDAER